ncbi:hypothetical protein HZH66_002725 [Vespula vulgaris]|uniref:Uncharacterized protein n=1 Tax=Vespula vulgaris TaxID=7454 RepID=A0A834KKB6_VESVU|nr:hypothetical protein HZH66_002725 [Vespula vulgaris]
MEDEKQKENEKEKAEKPISIRIFKLRFLPIKRNKNKGPKIRREKETDKRRDDGTPATEKTSKAHERQVSSGGKLNSQTGGCGDRPAAGTGTDAAIFTVGYHVSFAPFQPQLCAT